MQDTNAAENRWLQLVKLRDVISQKTLNTTDFDTYKELWKSVGEDANELIAFLLFHG